MFSKASKAGIAGAMRRTIPKGIQWSVFAPVKIDTDFGTNKGATLFKGLNVRFKRLNAADRPENYVTEKRPMYRLSAIGFVFAVGHIIRVEDDPSYGIFEVVETTPPPDAVNPTMNYALCVRTN